MQHAGPPGANIDARGGLTDHGEGTGARLLLWRTLFPAVFHRKTSLEWFWRVPAQVGLLREIS